MTLRAEPYAALENEQTFRAIEAFEAVAADRGVEPATLAIAWVLSHPQVTAVVVGPRRPEQLEAALGGLDLRLSLEERDGVDETLHVRFRPVGMTRRATPLFRLPADFPASGGAEMERRTVGQA